MKKQKLEEEAMQAQEFRLMSLETMGQTKNEEHVMIQVRTSHQQAQKSTDRHQLIQSLI